MVAVTLMGLNGRKLGGRLVAVVFIALLAGFGLGCLFSFLMLREAAPRAAAGIVGIIRVEGYIESPEVANQYVQVINRAMDNESIRAVVLVVDSGGGYIDYVEQIYLDLLMLKRNKTLVASLVTALSGGYYIAVAADYIYTHPTSYVGNVGVVGIGPQVLIPSEYTLETGAYKATGFSTLLFPYNLSHALDNFVSAVEAGRGGRLKLSSEELRRGLIYLGTEALKAGLVDEVGSLQKAVADAVERAGLKEYEVVELRPQMNNYESMQASYNYTRYMTLERLNELHPPPAIHFIYLPPKVVGQEEGSKLGANVTYFEGGGDVLVDVSHGNVITWWDLDVLMAELAERNVTVSFISSWRDLEARLKNATCLTIASPTEVYSAEEAESIEDFVNRGGLLLLLFDPSWEYIGSEGLSQGIIAPINSLSHRFTITFAKGYLYNQNENYGIYRNIYIRDFADSPLTRSLNTVVFFTATHIHSADNGVAWTSDSTYSSTGEKPGKYSTIALAKRGNGTIAAFGDITFLSEPWCYVEDNYQLIVNLASLMAEAKITKPPEKAAEEEIAKPNLPVGTEKIYTEWVNGREGIVRWLKVSETEVVVERGGITFHYYYNLDGALTGWSAENASVVLKEPVPDAPYPLTQGERWSHETPYILSVNGEEYEGRLISEEEVISFEYVESEDGVRCFCAMVRFNGTDMLIQDEMRMKRIATGYYWVSSEVGEVKEESTTLTYLNNSLYDIEVKKQILKTSQKGK